MLHARPHQFAKAAIWRVLGALLLGCVSITPGAIPGEMYRWTDAQGHIHLTDTLPKSKGPLQELKAYRPSLPGQTHEPSAPPVAEPGSVKMTATKPGGTVVVDTVVNRRLTVPMLLDTGADFTILTKQMARELRLFSLDRLPKQEFKTAGGPVKLPVTTLQSLRVGTAEASDIDVAIDVEGHMPISLLGMTFLRHFKVTVDHQRGRVTFAR